MADKPCLICVHADFSNVVVGSFLGSESEAWFCFDCKKCELIGSYGERECRTEQIMHQVGHGTYHIDGGESSSACRNYEMRNDLSPENIEARNRESLEAVEKK